MGVSENAVRAPCRRPRKSSAAAPIPGGVSMLDNERLAPAMHRAATSGSAIHLNLVFTGLPEAVIL